MCHTMHLKPGVAKQPNLELKTRPKQLLGSLPLVIALPGQCHYTFFSLLLTLWHNKLDCLLRYGLSSMFNYLWVKQEPTLRGSTWKTVLSNIGHGWKSLPGINKHLRLFCLFVNDEGRKGNNIGWFHKTFFSIIYTDISVCLKCWLSSLYYKCFAIVNDDRKVRFNL
jgi:hypothetical protein